MSIKNIKPNSNSKYYQSYFTPTNESKYVGEYPIICRSLLEQRMCTYLDLSDEVTSWASEPFAIKYNNINDKKIHKYYPDYIFVVNEQKILAEVKPKKQLKIPKEPKKKSAKSMHNFNESMDMYIKNYSKIKAVEEFSKKSNLTFVLVTEDTLDALAKKLERV